jgi:hypothetical protein
LAELNQAHDEGDSDYLFDHLHPAVIDRYGAAQCQLYLDQVAGSISNLEASSAQYPFEFNYATDGLERLIPDSVRIEITYVAQGQELSGAMHVIISDDEGRWFTDCGKPTGP